MKEIRTGTGQPEITCQNLGCYHAASNRLNRRSVQQAAAPARQRPARHNLQPDQRNKYGDFFRFSGEET